MISPPGSAGTQEARGANRGRDTNPNYVRIVNPANERVVKAKLAREWVADGRAEWVTGEAEIRLTDDSRNLTYRDRVRAKVAATNTGYDSVRSGFEWQRGISGGAAVLMARRGPAA